MYGIEKVITRYNLVYFLKPLNRCCSQENDDDMDSFALSSKDDKAPQAKRRENAQVPSIIICDLTP